MAKKKKHVFLPVLSFDSFIEQAARVLSGGRASGADDCSVTNDNDFTGGASFEDALRMARMGWPEGVQRLQALLPTEGGVEQVTQWALDVGGAFPCVPAFLMGDPECMWNQVQVEGARRRIALCAPMGALYHISAAARFEYGAALAQVVAELVAANIDVALYSVQHSTDRTGNTYTVGVAIRDFGAPLDLSRIAFAGHPAIHRRLRFAWTETMPEFVEIGSGGYGYTTDLTPECLLAILPDVDMQALRILPTIQNNRSTRAEWVEQFRRVIQQEATPAAAA